MRVDNEEDEEEDMGVQIVSTSQYAGVRTRKGKVLVWSALGDNTLILKRDCVAGDVLMLSSCSSGFHFAMVKKEINNNAIYKSNSLHTAALHRSL